MKHCFPSGLNSSDPGHMVLVLGLKLVSCRCHRFPDIVDLFMIKLLHKHQGCAKMPRSQDYAPSPRVQSRLQKCAGNTLLTHTSAYFVYLLFAAKTTTDCGLDFMIDQALLGMKH
jgi:hypothetical protein